MSYSRQQRGDSERWVRTDLDGRHKEHCMCWDCASFKPEREDKGCAVIQQVLGLAAKENIVLPVWECARFLARK